MFRNFRPFCLLLAGFLVLVSSAGAQETHVPSPEQHPVTAGSRMRFPMEQATYAPAHSEGILGRLFPRIHGNEALHFDYIYTGGVFNNARGGARTKGATTYNGIFDLGITADTEKLGLWKNGTFYMHSMFSHGRSPSRYVGDYQDVSVFAYEVPAQVSEYWYEHRLFRDALTIRGGKMDAGADFFYLESTADFINASATCVPTTGIPTTPDNAWGISGYLDVTENICLKVGIFDADANANKFWMSESGNVYSAYQVEFHYDLFEHLPGFAYVGAWYDNSDYELSARPDRTRTGSYGYNFGFEQMVYRKHVCDDEDLRGLTFFFQYGGTQKDRNELKYAWSFGLQWLGLFEDRPDDSLGFGVNKVLFSDGFRRNEDLAFSHETAYEIYYKAQVTENVSVQPVFQYVVHPGGEFRNAFVPGLVFQLVF